MPLLNSLSAISPVDGRYRRKLEVLADYFSEQALIKYRLIAEGEYLIALSEHSQIDVRRFSVKEKEIIRKMYKCPIECAERVRELEFDQGLLHDVKAGEYLMKEKLKFTTLEDVLEWIHFSLTSEDVNNISFSLMLAESLRDVLIPKLDELHKSIDRMAKQYKKVPMLARTHGQAASPTTFGKECKVFATRLGRQIDALKKYKILVKWNGATGNFNAHTAAYPNVDWVSFSNKFIKRLAEFRNVKFEINPITTQIESHDTYAELFDMMRRINTILIDFDQDMWRYISDHWIVQKPREGQVGSSTMPHKVNPLDFENSEGNLGIANALLGFFSTKLPISRLQRDLTDSTVSRNFGVAFAHSLLGYLSTLRGLEKISVNENKMRQELQNHPEIISEAIQTVLRVKGVPVPYEKLKALTQGKVITLKDIYAFVDSLDIDKATKNRLKKFTPENYIGWAARL